MLRNGLLALLCALCLTGCGLVDGSNGENGKSIVGPAGPVGPQGPKGDSGPRGEAGQAAVVGSVMCTGKVAGSDVSYDVLWLSDGLSVGIFTSNYVSEGGIQFTDAVSKVFTKALADKAPLDSKLWKAELLGKTQAKITRKNPPQSVNINCVSQ